MKLIRELNENDCSTLLESNENGSKSYYIEGIFMQGNIKNRNGRVYPSHILENELSRYNENFISKNRALGELGHPSLTKINEDRVSHMIVSMNRQGDDFYGKARVLSTPMGNIVKTFIDEGVKIGVSTRGLGSLTKNRQGIMEVRNDFHLVTVDIVTDPSGPDCFVNGLLENTEFYYDIASGNWVATKLIEDTVKDLKSEYKSTVKKFDEARILEAFEKFMGSISGNNK